MVKKRKKKKTTSKSSSKSKQKESIDLKDSLLKAYVAFRQFFQPYYRYYPKPKKDDKAEKRKKKRPAKRKSSSRQKKSHSKQTNQKRIKIFNYPKPLDKGMSFKKKPSVGNIWYYHDGSRHQLFGHFEQGSGYTFKSRSNTQRKKLRPLIYPKQGKAFDRTHTIPIGYHGSEMDPRLLIGWDSTANRKLFNEFEQKMKKLKFPIYWMTLIKKTKSGATWKYMVYDARNDRLVDSLEHSMSCPFVWKG